MRECLRALFRGSDTADELKYFTQELSNESSKHGIAATNAFVLLEWCTLLLEEFANEAHNFKTWGLEAMSAAARALETCLGATGRTSLKHSALVVARRGLRSVLRSSTVGEDALRGIVTKLTSRTTSIKENGPYIGVVSGVTARLTERKPLLAELKKDILAFYVRDFIGSKAVVPTHLADSLSDFFQSFIDDEDFQTQIVPPLEKGILRAPEIVLSGLIPPLAKSLPEEIDLSEAVYSKLLKGLLSGAKSTNPAVRAGVGRAFESLITRCGNENWLSKVADEIVAPLKASKITNPEQRILHVQMLGALPTAQAVSKSIVMALIMLSSKEANEGALDAEAAVICKHLAYMLANGCTVDQSVFDAILKGCGEKRTAFRKVWTLSTGDLFWKLDKEALSKSSQAVQFLGSTITKLQETFKEIVSNPLPAAQAGYVSVAFVLTALSGAVLLDLEGDMSKIGSRLIRDSLTTSPKLSFLLNPRIYTKLTSRDDLTWVIRALASVAKNITTGEGGSAQPWAQAFLYLITAADVPSVIRQEAGRSLAEAYLSSPALIGETIIGGLWHWLRAIESGDRDSAAVASKAGTDRLSAAVRSITPRRSTWNDQDREHSEGIVEGHIIDLLILCRSCLLPGTKWIETSLRVDVDPGRLVNENTDRCLDQILLKARPETQNPSPVIEAAAYDASAELAFVAPGKVLPLLIQQIKDDLNPSQLTGFGPTEAAIARTPAGVAFIDVLSTKGRNQLLEKNIKDYDTLKWEEDLRSQMAQKKGQQKKLTPEEQSKVNAQLAKEAAIRQDVQVFQRRIRRGAGIISSLALGPPTDAEGWMNEAITALLNAAQANAGLFVGEAVMAAYIACSEKISTRLGTLRPFIGIATLRALGEPNVAPELQAEDLGELVTRVLYRLRFAAEQRAFDVPSLSYILPLVFLVLDRSAIGLSPGDDADEQVLLALEFLSFHMDSCADIRLPRAEILSQLICSAQKYTPHYRLIKDALMDLCRCISGNIQPKELSILLEGTVVPEVAVVNSVLQAVRAEIDLTDLDFSEQIWLCCHNNTDETRALAEAIWEENALEADQGAPSQMIKYLEHPDRQIRAAGARALAALIEVDKSTFKDTLLALQEKYSYEARPKVPERDAYGMIKKMDVADHWGVRSGIALAFQAMSTVFDEAAIVSFVTFLIERGPLADQSGTVRQEMTESGTNLIASRGQEKVEPLMDLFEKTLESSDKASEQSDWVNEAVIVLYGSLARHLQSGDPRLEAVISKLLATLQTPSETVQYAVADCLPPLIKLVGPKTSTYVQQMLDQMMHSKKYAARRGAAYGLAGIVRGKGVSALREYRIMSLLRSASDNKKDPNSRQGGLLAYELLSLLLGRTFEPYVLQIVPQLLASFGDASIDVREACLDAAKTCFSNLSSFGVKQILPTLLEGLEESQWRSKKGACDLLGAMAYLDPQQLAASLPDIIPPLTAVLNDSHKEVRSSANRSLQRFGDVISNPEVKSLVNVLLKALSDPTKHTDEALDALIKVNFIHYLDSPSLALVVRILERGLEDRSATKRKAAQIIGSLAHLTERRDLISHLPILVAGLRLAIVDPVPTTRATASKALGSLVEKLGEDALPDLIPSLMTTLKSDTGAGDRLGSAQALSEVLAGLGTGRLEETLPTILQNVSSSKSAVREGFMSLFIFLPACFGNGFAAYLSRIIPAILGGLADDVEAIRDTALRAGRLLVKNFATKAIDLLLPELERGLADDSYRIRLSSVELVGDLLFNLTGISNKAETDEEDESATQAGQSLLEVLGEEKRNKVLSSLYICRCDTSGQVRSAAIAVWKALVATPRTLKDLVPTLSQLIIRRLASSNMEHKVIAGNALGELIRKAGEGVLATLLPVLEEGLQTNTDADSRQGICIALREVITSASPDVLEDYEKTLISVVRTALVDQDSEVREAAAEAFDSLQRIFGKRAIDQVLPYLLNLLRSDEEAENALSALLTLLTETTRSNVILPNLIPTLLAPPISPFNAKALASLAEVAGPAMTRRLPTVLNSLMDNIVATKDESLKAELGIAFDAVLSSVDEFDGLNTAMSVILALVKHDDHKRRAYSAMHLATFFSDADVDFSRYNQDLIRVLLISFDDRDSDVVKAAWAALSQLTAHLRKEEMEGLVFSTRQILQQVGVAGSNLPGFGLPKGINAILPIFLQGLMNGTVEQRTQSALAISDIIDRTSPDSLKPFVTQITGPLIRVVSERSVDVKCAILLTLNNLLEKIPTFLKPFLPQLQRTFAKSLADTSSETLRIRAAKALGTLITLTPRVDPLVAELVTGSKTPDTGVRNAMLQALHEVVSKAGANMGEPSRQAILGLIDSDTSPETDAMSITNARLLGALIKNLPSATSSPLIKNRVLTNHFTHASVLALNAVLLESPATLTDTFPEETPAIIRQGIASKEVRVPTSIIGSTQSILIPTFSPSCPTIASWRQANTF